MEGKEDKERRKRDGKKGEEQEGSPWRRGKVDKGGREEGERKRG